ncbi:MAG: multidrug effflux MFS transporter [Hyphomicrobiales bacterium]
MANATADMSLAKRPSTFLLVLIVSISPLTMHIYLPSLPGLAADLQASDAQVQLTLSVYLFAVAVTQLIIGPLSDRFGRRPMLIWGMVIFLIATVFCRFATSIDGLIIARGFQAIGGCAGMVIGRAIVRDVASRDQAASLLGYVTMGMAIAQMIGPVIGGFLDGFYGWRASFDLLLLLGVALLVLVVTTLHETHQSKQTKFSPTALWNSHAALLGEPRFWAFSLTGAMASGVFFAFLGGGPIISQRELGLAPVEYGLYFTLIAAGYALGNYISGRFSVHFGPPRMILYGNVMALLAMVLMAALVAFGALHPLSLFGPMLLSSLANGLTMPNSISGALSVRPELAGTASGLSGSLQVMVGAMATVVVGWTLHLGLWPLITLMIVLAVLALIAGVTANALEMRATQLPVPVPARPQ